MRKISFLLIGMALLFSACEGPIETIHFDSPDGDRSITVTGTREAALDPIVARVTLKTPGMEDDFSFEHQASSLTKENVTVEWVNNNHAVITFKLDDGEAWECECFLLDDRLQAVKRFKGGGSIFDQ